MHAEPMPAAISRLERGALAAGAAGLGACAMGFFLEREQVLRSWLLAWLFWTGVSIGCLSISFLGHLTGGRWALLSRRFLEAGTRLFPLLALAFLPILAGAGSLYPWVHPGDDPILAHKSRYLNLPFFGARAALYFAIWMALAFLLDRWSRQLDEEVTVNRARRLRRLSAAGILLIGITVTFSAIDWGMSLAPHWFSHIYGVLFLVGDALSALALVIACIALTAGERPMAEAIRPGIVSDLGKLLLAFTMLWAYVNFSQFLIIWSGNLAEETPFYLARTAGGWQAAALALVVLHFALPFLLLLSRDLKRDPRRLGALAAVLLAARLLDLYWLIGPDLRSHGHGHGPVPFAVHWLDLVAPLGLGGLWLFGFARRLRTRPLLPFSEPGIAELLASGAQGAHR
jgi:hypothetical protein